MTTTKKLRTILFTEFHYVNAFVQETTLDNGIARVGQLVRSMHVREDGSSFVRWYRV